MRSFRWNALWIMVVMLLVTACVAPVAPENQPAGDTSAGADEKVTITFWDQSELSEQMDKVVADFNAANPDIEVVREPYETNAMRDVIKTALDSGSGPDIFYYDLGPGFAGVLAKAGLVMPLDDAYAEYGWDKRIFPWTRERSTFDGKSYGVANALEFIGVYYNKDIFATNGWSEPKDWNEFLALCDKAKAADLIPIAFANGESWPSYHMFSMMMNNIVGKDRLAAMISGEESWDNPDTVAAIKMFFVDMNEAGYFVPDVNSVTYNDGNSLFQTGEAAMLTTGTWLIEQLTNPDNTEVPVGFFFLPSIDGKPVVVPGGIGSGWLVSSKTEHPEATLKFLNFLISDEMGKRWITDLKIVPAFPVDTSALEIPELLAFALDIIGKQAGGMGYNIDVLTPDNYNKVMWDGFSAVLAGARTPEEQAAELQKAMDEAKEKGNVIDITN